MSDPHIPTPCETLVRAGILVLQDAARTVLEDGGLALSDGKVLAAGPWAEVAAAHDAPETLDLSGCLVLPGLVNTHTHAPMTAFRGLADDLPLMQWLTDHIWPVENRLTPEVVYDGALLACAEMLASGTTCFADMYLFQPDAARAVERMGLRAMLGTGVLSFATRAYDTPDEAFGHIEAFAESLRGSALVGAAVAPHAVYTTSPEVLRKSFELAERLDVPWMIHAAENAEETARSLEMFGKRPVPYLADLGCLTPRAVLVHMTDLTDGEIAAVAASGAGVSHNPRSNMKLACGHAPVAEMLAAGVPVGLGTDGAGSSNCLNLFSVMRATALTQKARTADATAVPAQAVLDMATLGGGRLLGRPELGRLTPGAAADLTALDLDAPNMVPLYNPASHLAYAASGAEVRLSMVAGRAVYRDGRFAGAEPQELAACAERLRAWALGG